MQVIFKEHIPIIFYPIKPIKLENWEDKYINYIIEPKYNGWHCLFIKYKNKIGIYSRNLKLNLTQYVGLNYFVNLLYTLKENIILVGEVVVKEGDNPKAVSSLKSRALSSEIKIFDVYREGKLTERRKYLEGQEILKDYLIEQYKINNLEELNLLIEKMKEDRLIEGIILKNPDSYYIPSRNTTVYTNDWLKFRWKY